ncbi:MAG: sigma-54-dependent Fis family transcriptional regulator, partial [Salinisphaera sp.]|nr:sigma-54-dependent Fis family transcriptional regulator [Salinisphaera sp.]
RERSADIPLLAAAIVEKLAANLALDALPQLTEEAVATLQAHPFPGNVRELENVLERAVTLTEGKVIDPDTLVLKAAPSAQAAPPATPPADGSLGGQIENLERRSILDALEATRYNKTRAAKKLGITFRALRYRLKKLGIES